MRFTELCNFSQRYDLPATPELLELSGVGIVSGANCSGGNFPRGNCLGEIFQMGIGQGKVVQPLCTTGQP